MQETTDIRNPYSHMKRAKQFEAEDNMRSAESEWKLAVRAADSLPLPEYKKALRKELLSYAADASYEAHPGMKREDVMKTFAEVLSLPFLTRIELSGFYARNGALPEAWDACNAAFSMTGKDLMESEDARLQELFQRARILRQNIEDALGPENMEQLFERNLEALDHDGNGFVHQSELRGAQFDLSLSPECQLLIRHLLSHYFEIEAAHHDEWGIDINGITLRDIQCYVRERNANWKRMGKKTTEKVSGHHHVW